jgi:hypothetical protein
MPSFCGSQAFFPLAYGVTIEHFGLVVNALASFHPRVIGEGPVPSCAVTLAFVLCVGSSPTPKAQTVLMFEARAPLGDEA